MGTWGAWNFVGKNLDMLKKVTTGWTLLPGVKWLAFKWISISTCSVIYLLTVHMHKRKILCDFTGNRTNDILVNVPRYWVDYNIPYLNWIPLDRICEKKSHFWKLLNNVEWNWQPYLQIKYNNDYMLNGIREIFFLK